MSDVCSICLEQIYHFDKYITQCKHTYHNTCFRQYKAHCYNKKKNVLCPLCNKELEHYYISTSHPTIQEATIQEVETISPSQYIYNYRTEFVFLLSLCLLFIFTIFVCLKLFNIL